jgi:hypothetical protein
MTPYRPCRPKNRPQMMEIGPLGSDFRPLRPNGRVKKIA